MCACTYTYMYIFVYTRRRTYMHACIHTLQMYIRTHAACGCIDVYMYTYTRIHVLRTHMHIASASFLAVCRLPRGAGRGGEAGEDPALRSPQGAPQGLVTFVLFGGA